MSYIFETSEWSDHTLNYEYADGIYTPFFIEYPIVDFEGTYNGADSISGIVSSSPLPLTVFSKNVSGHLFESFYDDYYNRIHITPPSIDLGNIVTDQQKYFNVFNAYFEQKTLLSIQESLTEGLVLGGQSTPYIYAPLEQQEYSLTIDSVGLPEINATYFFNWQDNVDDYYLPVTGKRITSIPYQFGEPCSEVFEWETSIIESYDGTEQRIKTRAIPRQGLNVTYILDSNKIRKVENIMYGWMDKIWAIPMWMDAKQISSLSIGEQTINIDTTNADYRDSSLIFIYTDSFSKIVSISSYTDSQLNLSEPLLDDYINPYVMPARVGRIKNKPKRKTNGYNGDISVEYEIIENIQFAPSAPAQYKNYDIYTDDILIDGGFLSDEFDIRIDAVDYSSGAVYFNSPWQNTKISRQKNIILEGQEDIWNYKQWLHRREGRYLPFWVPTFENNFKLAGEGLISTTIIVVNDSYTEFSSNRKDIAIRLKDNTWQYREIIASSINVDGTENLTIDNTLGHDYSDVSYISFLDLKRLSSDSVELTLRSGKVVESSVGIIDI